MIKKLHIFSMALLIGIFSMNAQTTEVGPYADAPNINNSEALFDLLYVFDIGASIGAASNTGVMYHAAMDQYWISVWNSNLFHILDGSGDFVETITIPGVSDTRSITQDGTLFYTGSAGLEIFIIDPVLRLLNGTINIVTGSSAAARMLTFDETLDGGNGGFWIGNFSSDIASVDMSGNELSVIDALDHGTVAYGGAVDNISPGGPFLWVHDQSGTAPNRDFITQLALPSGIPTGVVYDFTVDGAANGATEVLAGGLSISADVDPGAIAILGVCQCTPSNLLFAIELVPILGNDDNALSNFNLYPNPANGSYVNIETSIPGEKQVVVFDVLGKKIISTVISDKQLDISALTAGIYMVQITQNNITATKKLVIR